MPLNGCRVEDIGGFQNRVWAGDPARLACLDVITGERLTCGEVAEWVPRIASGLESLGVGPGDQVLLTAPTSIPALLSCWALWRLGAVPMPLDPTWPNYLLDAVLSRVTPRLVLASAGQALGAHLPTFVIADSAGAASAAVRQWRQTRPAHPFRAGFADPDQRPGVVLFTSGSTGLPKGVMLSQGALLRSAQLVAQTFQWRPGDRFLNLAELHSMSGLRNTCLAAAACGAAVLLAPAAELPDPFRLARVMAETRPTVLGSGPLAIGTALRFRDRLEPDGWTGLRQAICTGGPLPTEDARAFQEWTGAPVINYYGLTETTGICIAHTPESARACDGTLGWPVGATCRVLADPECPEAPGGAGELVVAGPNLMLGYLGQPELTAEVLRGGWFHTGDWARIHADGRIELVGRIRNCIKTGHTDLLFPEEIETALAGHPDLQDAAAVRVASGPGAEHFLVLLVPRAGWTDGRDLVLELHGFLKERLGPKRLPGGYRVVQGVPRLENGKIDRTALLEYATHGE